MFDYSVCALLKFTGAMIETRHG